MSGDKPWGGLRFAGLALRAGHSACRSVASLVLCSSSRNASKNLIDLELTDSESVSIWLQGKKTKEDSDFPNLKDLQPKISLFSYDCLSHPPQCGNYGFLKATYPCCAWVSSSIIRVVLTRRVAARLSRVNTCEPLRAASAQSPCCVIVGVVAPQFSLNELPLVSHSHRTLLQIIATTTHCPLC